MPRKSGEKRSTKKNKKKETFKKFGKTTARGLRFILANRPKPKPRVIPEKI